MVSLEETKNSLLSFPLFSIHLTAIANALMRSKHDPEDPRVYICIYISRNDLPKDPGSKKYTSVYLADDDTLSPIY